MSRYLLPIDDGDEIQHLGRTLECQLCGLRGKRCHLTLHFKAKHSEVIELDQHRRAAAAAAAAATSIPAVNVNPTPPPPPSTCAKKSDDKKGNLGNQKKSKKK